MRWADAVDIATAVKLRAGAALYQHVQLIRCSSLTGLIGKTCRGVA